uniref:Ubiquitin-like domain-containing protein n=1 Tax=Acrobeloides nanus TaxID=290746 RepID=A0A914DFZ4_9BILA
MKVFIKLINCKIRVPEFIEVEEHWTTSDLLNDLSCHLNLPVNAFKVILNGKTLKESNEVLGIRDGIKVNIMLDNKAQPRPNILSIVSSCLKDRFDESQITMIALHFQKCLEMYVNRLTLDDIEHYCERRTVI